MPNRMRIGGNASSLLEKIDKKLLVLAGNSVGGELEARIGHRGLFAAMEEALHALTSTGVAALNWYLSQSEEMGVERTFDYFAQATTDMVPSRSALDTPR